LFIPSSFSSFYCISFSFFFLFFFHYTSVVVVGARNNEN
jgi:hypothetical protein